ncbi:MAG: NAD(P)/FAD-dependent oxidoreductase [Deltaproteobacteria bacterium]|nr:MAG: NAD(P)/FAD-dependent oxidoreductase [Deltaproteobacteria bacterium]
MNSSPRTHGVVIVGGGTAGITVAARLRRAAPELDVAIVEPSEVHYYQPLWTLVGGGLYRLADSARSEARYVPEGVTWICDRVAAIDPERRTVDLEGGGTVGYEQLVVAPGIRLAWERIEGLDGAVGDHGIASNYDARFVEKTFPMLDALDAGTAVFTFPKGPIKCAGAPQKIMWLADHLFRRKGIRGRTNVVFASAGQRIFGVEKYRVALERLVETRDIDTRFSHELVAVRPASREAVFRHGDREEIVRYDFIHVTPPQAPPGFIADSGLGNEAGWCDVDKYTLQHVRYPDIFSLGDASSLPTSKTGAAVRKEAPVLVDNLLAHRAGRPLAATYDGYASCPLTTRYGRVMLAEFDYEGRPAETFPFDQAKERWSMWVLKTQVLPRLYWYGMLRGRA